jgi:2-oxo-4-hydroxy-4-carboxy-5-ureidoimidazoline decarboxylase
MQWSLAELNSLDSPGFVEAIGWVFEDSPWVAERVWERRPFSCLESLLSAMIGEVDSASEKEQLHLLRAHPDLGARVRMGTASAAEQAGAGLDSLTAEELQRIRALNSAYRSKFGFPFLYAVKGSTKTDILRNLEQRIEQTPETEYRDALRQVYLIAEFRLHDAVQ